jgi:hypothetical protein
MVIDLAMYAPYRASRHDAGSLKHGFGQAQRQLRPPSLQGSCVAAARNRFMNTLY